jgi:3-hydroxyacyl-[acyl-carrier-protein] dehydratase
MPPPLLIDLSQIDLNHAALTRDEVYRCIPQAFEFQLLDGMCMLDPASGRGIGFADIRPDAWWVRGHVPGRTLLPGVLMLEMAAQTSAVLARLVGGQDAFIGFGGVDQCKFREAVTPPARLFILCVGAEMRSRRIVSDTQGVIDGRVIFEARITGLALR